MTLKEFEKAIIDIFCAKPLTKKQEEDRVNRFLKMLLDARNRKIPEKD